MKLQVQRQILTPFSTVGALTIDGQFECFTLEPRVDRSQGKPYAIPAGTYEGILQHSPRFEMVTPHLLGVPDFTEIEIHPGNSPKDTHGCTLVGQFYHSAQPDFIGESREAFGRLMEKLRTAFEITYF